ncbi:MAG: Coq4 family protein [Phycisphaerales bacterium]|nr:Coq4 family protein [Phycisphaerales bacterium]
MKRILQVSGDEAQAALSLLKCVATADGQLQLHEIHRATLQAFADHLFHVEVDIDGLPGTLDGAADAVADETLRREVLNMAGILPFLEDEDKETRVATFEQLNSAFGFNRKFARELYKLCHGSVTEISICQLRPALMESGKKIHQLPGAILKNLLHVDGDKKMLARYQGYCDLPEGTFGKVLSEYYRDNHFPLPGTKGAFFSNNLTIHDMHHVLGGYPTTPLGETCVVAFADGMMDLDLGKAVIGAVAQFQIGIQFDKGLEVWLHQFNPDVVIRAFERGARATTNFEVFGFDFEPYMQQPLADVRAQMGIEEEGAIIKGPGDRWCGEMGVVGQRSSPDMIDMKMSWFQKLLAGKNVEEDLAS